MPKVDVDVTHNVKIEGIEKLEATLADLKIALSDIHTPSSYSASPTTNKDKPTAFNAQLNNLTNVINKLSESITKAENERQKNKAQQQKNNQNSSRQLGSVLKASMAYASVEAGRFGSYFGNQSNILNNSFSNVSQFELNQANKKQEMLKDITGASGIAASTSGAIIGGWKGLGLGIAGMGVSALGGAYSEQNKALNSRGTKEAEIAYILKSKGYSNIDASLKYDQGLFGISSKSAGISSLQSKALKDNPLFAYSLGDTAYGSRADIFSRSSDKDKIAFNTQLNILSKLLDNPDIKGLSKIATNFASATGMNPVKAVNTMIQDNLKYSGDTADNTAKIVQLMSSTPMGYRQASDIVNRYQYNSGMMNNQIAQSVASPNQLWMKDMWMKLAGADEKEIKAGRFGGKNMAHLFSAQKSHSFDLKSMMMMNAMAMTGENIFANDRTTFKGNMGNGTSELTDFYKQLTDDAKEQLSKLDIKEQHVEAKSVIINMPSNKNAIKWSNQDSTGFRP
jgi:hypothetical protein